LHEVASEFVTQFASFGIRWITREMNVEAERLVKAALATSRSVFRRTVESASRCSARAS